MSATEQGRVGAKSTSCAPDRPSVEPMHPLAVQLAGLPYPVQTKLIEPPIPPALHLAPTAGVVQCDVEDSQTSAPGLTADQVFFDRTMTLRALVDYIDAHPDWAQSSSLSEDAVGHIQQQLDFVGQAPDVVLAGCGNMPVGDLRNAQLSEENQRALLAYCAAVRQDHPTVMISRQSNVDVALEYGSVLVSLEAVIPGAVLHEVADEESLSDLIFDDHLSDFVRYVQHCDPILSAVGGKEIDSYLELWAEGVDPASYSDQLKQVRNYHHFEKAALDRLVKNYQEGNRDSKPLTLILHASIDYNGGFHRDDEVTLLVTSESTFTLLIEGVESLAEISGELGDIAGQYGRDGQIEQVVIAGHGGSRSIQMAGRVSEQAGEMVTEEDRLTLDDSEYGSAERSEALFTELLSHMPQGEGAEGRIVLAACLTNSNLVEADLDPDNPQAAAEQIQNALNETPNLVRYLTEMVADQGDFEVFGANASTWGIRYVDASTGEIFLKLPRDREAIGPKLDYVRTGGEPSGVLRAVVECFADANERRQCFEAMEDRISQGGSNWFDGIIVTLFQIILDRYRSNAQMINQLAHATAILRRLGSGSSSRTSHGCVERLVRELPPTEFEAILGSLSTYNAWQRHVPIVAYQAWLAHDATKTEEFIASFTTEDFDCRHSFEYVDIPFLSSRLSLILPLSAAASPLRGHLVVALLAVIHQMGGPPQAARDFLLATLDGRDAFPEAYELDSLLDGLRTENEILTAIGARPS